jgi:hypothetical protein
VNVLSATRGSFVVTKCTGTIIEKRFSILPSKSTRRRSVGGVVWFMAHANSFNGTEGLFLYEFSILLLVLVLLCHIAAVGKP